MKNLFLYDYKNERLFFTKRIYKRLILKLYKVGLYNEDENNQIYQKIFVSKFVTKMNNEKGKGFVWKDANCQRILRIYNLRLFLIKL